MAELDIAAANQRLMEKRAALGVTNSPTRLTPNINLVEIQPEEEAEKCKHGYRGRCWDCEKEERDIQQEAKQKNELRESLSDMDQYLKLANVPQKYINSSFKDFIGNEKLVMELQKSDGENIVLYGNTGCGKTHLAVGMIRNAFIKNINNLLNTDLCGRHAVVNQILFKPVPDLLLEIRQSFRDNARTSEEEIINKYCGAKLLVLDDLGSEKTTEYSITTLYIIIDRRDRDLLPTIITTNLSQKEIEEKLGARIASRLAGMKNIKINMPDYRKKRG
jgi:DNA replication protein DnaC